MANKKNGKPSQSKLEIAPAMRSTSPVTTTMYADSPAELNFMTLQQNLQNCLSIVDNEVMKNYVPALQDCSVVAFDNTLLQEINNDAKYIQFFRITELVYQEDEFSVHKLATVFNTLSNKPCTLVLMIQSDGTTNNFYLGVRSRGNSSTGTMKHLLEQSLLGLFPGSNTEEYLRESLVQDLSDVKMGCISSVTCIADYKQEKESLENKDFIQGLEKFIYSMEGKPFTAICIANNLDHRDLVDTKREYERIYTLLSPFTNMQYNYTQNQSSGVTESNTSGKAETDSTGSSSGVNLTETHSKALQEGTNQTQSITKTGSKSSSIGIGKNHTNSSSSGTNDSVTTTKTDGTYEGAGKSVGMNVGGISAGTNRNAGITSSVSRGNTHGTSHTDSISDSISKNLTYGISSSEAVGNTLGSSRSQTDAKTLGVGTQYSENQGHSLSINTAHTKALAETFGNSQSVTLNVQNKSLQNVLQRLEKQLERLDECESIGMWDFASYFLGESAAETETAASMYRSLISGNQSGLEIAAVNTWTDEERVEEIAKYVTNFIHPIFCYRFEEGAIFRETFVDATALVSTNELAIQLGLPRKSVKGLPVIEHALFAQEVLSKNTIEGNDDSILLGEVNHLGRKTETTVDLDLQSLSMHTFVTGSTGSGKSNTVYQILSQLGDKKVKFLVVEPAKGEYKNIFGGKNDVAVYGTNPMICDLLRINPFSFPKGIHIYEHLDRLVEIFNVCWPMYAAMPAILEDAIESAYVKAGWDLKHSTNKYADKLFPNFIDVLQQIDIVMEQSQYSSDNKSDYKGALSTRLRSLTNGINGLVFTSDEIPPTDLFDKNVIVDLSRVGSSETKSLIMGLLVMKLQEYRIATCHGMNAKLNHVTVLEEAHNLLKRTSTEQSSEGSNLIGKSVEMLTNAIAEMRTYGEGFIIADQSPGLLDMAVIRNTNTKIIMRLPEYSDRELVGRAASLNDEQISELAKLGKGIAAVYQNDWLEAVLCKVHRFPPKPKNDIPNKNEQPYIYKPRVAKKVPDIKGQIISKLITRDIYRLVDRIDSEDIIRADMPATAKCTLLEYPKTPPDKKLDSAATVAYELFSAQPTFSAIRDSNLDYKQQKRFLYENLTPSLTSLPEKYAQVILYLIIYRHAQLTESPASKLLLNNLIESEGKDEVY